MHFEKNRKLIIQIITGLFFLGMSLFFLKNELSEISNIKITLLQAKPWWLTLGLILVLFYTLVMAWMYQFSFKAISKNISLDTAVFLFLKRNLVSIFLPAGVLTNIAFFNKEVEKKESVTRAEIYFASSIYSVCSILSTLILGFPVLFWFIFNNQATTNYILGISLSLIFFVIIIALFYNLKNKCSIYVFLEKRFPTISNQINLFFEQSYDFQQIIKVILLSVLIEIIGIAHLYIAMMALNGQATLEIAILGYSAVLLLLMSSPFLRGIGAIEVALVFILKSYGISDAMAISITFLFRFFEFWSLLILGLVAFLLKKDNIFLRILPAFLLFILGVVNILSSLSPALESRLHTLNNFLPLEAVNGSNYLVLFSGFLMFITAVYLIKGLRNAWAVALILTISSFIGHIFKGIDFEEATLALVTALALIYQHKQYYKQSDFTSSKRYWFPGIISACSVIIFGTVAFFFINKVHFHENFTLRQSALAAIKTFFLFNVDLNPATKFGTQFLLSLNSLGILSMSYLAYIFFRPYIFNSDNLEIEERAKALEILSKCGRSNLDYFKTYFDKQYWFSENNESFVSFKNTSNYALVLESPVVSKLTTLEQAICEFDSYCRANNLKSAYYRVNEIDLPIYEKLGKKKLPIGQEAILNLNNFSLEGGKMKPMRNAISKVTKLGLSFHINLGPHKGGFMQKLKSVSDEWLIDMEREEFGFSQGMFDENELKNQVVFTVENSENKILAFSNMIPSYVDKEANFDLIRKTKDAPSGIVDYLLVNMFDYFRTQGFIKCTLGMVPMSGILNPTSFQERIIKLAYEKIKRFSDYRNLRFYKEKFTPEWEMKYLIYESTFDLIFLPSSIDRLMKIK